jgi:peptide/nickel transport system ATP-binding protein
MSIDAGAPLLAVRGLHLRLTSRPSGRGPVALLDDISLEVPPGGSFGIVGPSGAGKTTLARAVAQLLRPDGGSVVVAGHNLTSSWRRRFGSWVWSPSEQAERRAVQLVPQDFAASLDPRWRIDAIVAEPLAAFGLAAGIARRERVLELAAQVGLDRSLLGRRAHELSHGQKQRVSLARSLAAGPSLLICDEPVSALDLSMRAQVLHLLLGLRSLGTTLLVISHDVAALRSLCDRVAVMRDGRLLDCGR